MCDHMCHIGGAMTGILLAFIYLLLFDSTNDIFLLFHKMLIAITDKYFICCVLILFGHLVFNLWDVHYPIFCQCIDNTSQRWLNLWCCISISLSKCCTVSERKRREFPICMLWFIFGLLQGQLIQRTKKISIQMIDKIDKAKSNWVFTN